ncbi:MAG: hypothetical protein K2H98_02430 [Duncaniella sp.]|nr:hypothetical protein [Duncaniella sp.]
MESANVVSKYFTEYVRKGFRNIFAEQRAIAARKIYDHEAITREGYPRSRSHELERALQSPRFDIRSAGSGITANASYPSYIRFLDMKRLGNYRIYNRPVWGVLYKETFQDIRYEFSDWLRRNFGEEIRKSFQ